PRRPQDRVPLREARDSFLEALPTFGVEYGNHDSAVAETFPASDPTTEQAPGGDRAHAPEPDPAPVAVAEAGAASVQVELDGTEFELGPGSVVIAAITSCTNTSNPTVMVAAGLLAKNAVERGLKRRPWVK